MKTLNITILLVLFYACSIPQQNVNSNKTNRIPIIKKRTDKILGCTIKLINMEVNAEISNKICSNIYGEKQ